MRRAFGRQPWVVNGLVRVSDVVAGHGGGIMVSTLTAWLVLYAFLLVSYVAAIRHVSTKPATSRTLAPGYTTKMAPAPERL